MAKPNICIFGNILKSLGIPKYKDYATFLWRNNLYGHFDKMCQNSIKNCQYGGGKQSIKFEGVDFEFSKYKDKEYTMFELNTTNNIKCILIRINKEDNTAEILGIGYDPLCFTNKQIKHFKGKTSGGLLLKLALKFIDEIKDHYKLKNVTLQDNSHKPCHGFNIDLSKMYILMYGDTWYGNKGFIPYDPANKIEHKYGKNKYKNNIEIMNTVKVKDVPQLKKYLMDSYNNIVNNNKDDDMSELLLNREELAEVYNEYKNNNKLLKDFIQKFLIKYDKSCILFYSFYESLFDDLKLYDLHGKYYIKYV